MNKLLPIVASIATFGATVLFSGPVAANSLPAAQNPPPTNIIPANILSANIDYTNDGPFRAFDTPEFNQNKPLTEIQAQVSNFTYHLFRDTGMSPEAALGLTVFAKIIGPEEVEQRLKTANPNDLMAKNILNQKSTITGEKLRAADFSANQTPSFLHQLNLAAALAQLTMKSPMAPFLKTLVMEQSQDDFSPAQFAQIAQTISITYPIQRQSSAAVDNSILSALDNPKILDRIRLSEQERRYNKSIGPEIIPINRIATLRPWH
jgi:hypothetical protein